MHFYMDSYITDYPVTMVSMPLTGSNAFLPYIENVKYNDLECVSMPLTGSNAFLQVFQINILIAVIRCQCP